MLYDVIHVISCYNKLDHGINGSLSLEGTRHTILYQYQQYIVLSNGGGSRWLWVELIGRPHDEGSRRFVVKCDELWGITNPILYLLLYIYIYIYNNYNYSPF